MSIRRLNKTIWLLLILLFGMLDTFGQNVEIIHKPYQYTYSNTATVVGNGIYLDYSKGHYFNNVGSSSSVLKLDYYLNIIDSTILDNLVNSDTALVGVQTLDSFEDHLILMLGYVNNDSFYQDFIGFDSAMNVTNQFTLTRHVEGKRAYFFDMSVKDSVIYVSGDLYNESGFDDGLIMAVDFAGNTLYAGVVPADTLSFGSRDATITNLFLTDSLVIGTFEYTWDEHLAIFNRELSLLEFKILFTPLDTFGYQGSLQFTKNAIETPVLQSITSRFDWNYQPKLGEDQFYKTIGLVHLDSDYNILNRDTLPYTGWKTDTLTSFRLVSQYGTSAFGFASEDTIVTMATDNTMFWANWPVFEYFNISTSTYISAFDNVNKSVLWSKVYNNGVAHVAEEVTALPNNRWLLTFNEYDWNTYGPDNLAVRLVIIDGNGNPIGINEHEEKALTQEPLVFPNPATNYITIGNLHWPGNRYRYQLVDLNGHIVQTGNVPISGTINLISEFHGVYVLSITNQTGFGWARKILVE